LNGHPEYRLAGNLNICISGVESEALILALTNEVAISSGSACTTAAVEPSHVLEALGLTQDNINASIRIGIGRFNTQEEIVYAIEAIANEAKRLRALRKE